MRLALCSGMDNLLSRTPVERPPRDRRTLEAGEPFGSRIAELTGLLESLSRCGDAAELGLVFGAWVEHTFSPSGCVVRLAGPDGLAPAYEHRSAPGLWPPASEQHMSIEHGDRLLGTIVLYAPHSLRTDGGRLLTLAARALGAEVDRIQAKAELRREHERAEELRRYVPGVISRRIDDHEPITSGEREISVLFLDIHSYTATVSLLRSSAVFRLINRYVRAATAIIRQHGGSVVEFNGDGMMAVFGAPDPLSHKERSAAAAALELLDAVSPLLRSLGEITARPAPIGVGIATGLGYVGDIVADDRRIWTAVGRTTNLASRLEALTREIDSPLLVDEATWRGAGELLQDCRLIERIRIRGFDSPLDLYALPCALSFRGEETSPERTILDRRDTETADGGNESQHAESLLGGMPRTSRP